MKRRTRAFMQVAGVVTVAALVAACGGGGTTDDATDGTGGEASEPADTGSESPHAEKSQRRGAQRPTKHRHYPLCAKST